jgi:putative membrane protein
MIKQFSDHAANERTFLAWVRTAIAVMAFGFLVAKFDLFLRIAVRSLANNGHPTGMLPVAGFGGSVGAILIIAGTVMVAVAAWRFTQVRRAIESEKLQTDTERVDLALAIIMVALGTALLLYLVHALLYGV